MAFGIIFSQLNSWQMKNKLTNSIGEIYFYNYNLLLGDVEG